jgi:TRAP-type mannitol/chloroaromatic compound transport system substrate-binding protein
MSLKTKLLRNLESGDRGGVIADLMHYFKRSPDEKLEKLLGTVKEQYDDLTKLIKGNNLTSDQRVQREDVIDVGLNKIIEQLREEKPFFIWLLAATIALMLGFALFNKCFPKGCGAIPPPMQRDTFQFWTGSDTINYVINDGIKAMIQEIHETTKGRLTIELHRNTNRSEAANLLHQVSEGKKVQMFHSISYYWNQSLPASLFFASIPFGMSKEEVDVWLAEDGYRLWRALYQRDSIIPFALGNTGQQWGGWFNKEIHTLKDFNGLTMRMGGEGSKILDRLGVTITGLVPNVADLDSFFREDAAHKAFEWIGPYTDYRIGLHKYFKYYYEEGWHEPNTLYSLYINQAAWERVKDIQPILEKIIQNHHARISALFQVKNNEYRQKLIDEKGKDLIQHFPCALIKDLEIETDKHMKRYCFEHQKSHMMDSISKSYFRFHNRYKKAKPFSTCK